jgi:hypothetical protein
MSSALSLALAALTVQHNQEQAALDAQNVTKIVTRNAEPSKKQAAKVAASKGVQAAPIHDKPAVFGVTMPDRNTLDAKGFLQAMLTAGRRINDNGVRFTDPREVRNDQIQAIHAFVGYNPRESFGGQEVAARAKAHRDLRGAPVVTGPSREEQRAASRSLAGYIAGLPDHKARRLADLKARETQAVDAMIAHVHAARDKARPMFDRKLSIGFARVEKDRLAAIRNDISTFG